MKLNAVGVSSTDVAKTVMFYNLLGFEFGDLGDMQHVEAVNGGTRLMIDDHKIVASIIGEEPKPANHSTFAIEYNSPSDVNEIVKRVKDNSGTVFKQPWDAFWGQRYAIVEDPDGYRVDLYAPL